ncbi:hypothetical protein [Actinomadura rugatobispora]|uniref:Uncharacterized protein n=1 Tax=Actinomadura rugatobispora TaxID=1994 RepID=A0ABW0ZS14_9ACTN|nr:hypothetical protein GCM10010200_076120 [Actinomadura rugatobispora]
MQPDHPDELWNEAAGHALLGAALPSEPIITFEEDGGGLRRVEFGSGTWGIAWVDGGRAVTYGFDLDYSTARRRLPPVDLLAGAPGWFPWDYVHAAQKEIQLVSWVHWWDGETWARAEYPGDMDGVPDSGGEESFEGYADGSEDPDAARDAYDDLMAAVAARAVDTAVIEALYAPLEEALQPPDLTAPVAEVLDLARRLGVTPGASRPELAAGTGEPAVRRVHIMDLEQVEGAIAKAMRNSFELDRPAPSADPDEVAAWVRANLGETSIEVAYTGTDRPGHNYKLGIGWGKMADAELSALLDAWREREADPERGRWTHARVAVTADGFTADRAYDHLPVWWDGFRVHLTGLRAEMASRASRWRPSWTGLLDQDLAHEGVPLELTWRPGERFQSLAG